MRLLLASLPSLALAACSPSGESEATRQPEPQAPRLAEINAQPVVAPTGEAQLTPLAATAARAIGSEAGGCTFAYQSRPLLVADAAGAKAVAVIDGTDVELAQAGGEAGAGPVLAGGGYTLSVLPTGDDAADLAIAGPGGRKTVFTGGTWSCAR